MSPIDRILLALGAFSGLLGVVGSAAAAHSSAGETLKTASLFLLVHAPVLVGIAALVASGAVRNGPARLAAGSILVGLALFSGDLALRALAGIPLFPMAAPIGGIVLMAGWLVLAVTAAWPRHRG